ncbi:MAG: hypothetical protein AB7D33_14050 [Sphingobium sp.]
MNRYGSAINSMAVTKWAALACLGVAVLFSIWKWSEWRAAAAAGSAYAARITCSCRYVEGRSAKNCARDVADDASLVFLSERPEEKEIVGRVPFLGRATAKFRPGYGCLMQP